MKIEELLSEIKFKPRISDKSISGVIKTPSITFLANGIQSIVYSHKTHPNTVVKVAAVTGEDDPAWQFLRVCINHSNNPYFPKVFNHKVFNLKRMTQPEWTWIDKQPNYEQYAGLDFTKMNIVIVTEKLMHIDLNQFESMLKQLGIFKIIANTQQNLQSSVKWPISIADAWADAMKNPQSRREIRNIATDKHFKDAMRLLEPLFANTRYSADVHIANMMVRSNGQLVFNDPVAFTASNLYSDD
jgi:hypothetical protein